MFLKLFDAFQYLVEAIKELYESDSLYKIIKKVMLYLIPYTLVIFLLITKLKYLPYLHHDFINCLQVLVNMFSSPIFKFFIFFVMFFVSIITDKFILIYYMLKIFKLSFYNKVFLFFGFILISLIIEVYIYKKVPKIKVTKKSLKVLQILNNYYSIFAFCFRFIPFTKFIIYQIPKKKSLVKAHILSSIVILIASM